MVCYEIVLAVIVLFYNLTIAFKDVWQIELSFIPKHNSSNENQTI